MVYIGRSQRRLPTRPHCSSRPEVPPLFRSWQPALPVQGSPVWVDHVPLRLHPSLQGGRVLRAFLRQVPHPIPGRLESRTAFIFSFCPEYGVVGQLDRRTGTSRQRGQVRFVPQTGLYVCGGHFQSDIWHSNASRPQDSGSLFADQDVLQPISPASGDLAASSEASYLYGKTSAKRKTAHETSPVGFPSSVEPTGGPSLNASSPGHRHKVGSGVVVQAVHPSEGREPLPPGAEVQVVSDTSNHGWGGRLMELQAEGVWMQQERQLHINSLEMLAVFNTLQQFLLRVRGSHVLAMCDYTIVVGQINKQGGTHSMELFLLTQQLLLGCDRHDVIMSSCHIPGRLTF